MRPNLRIAKIFVLLTSLSSVFYTRSTIADPLPARAEWTVMVFMNADNNLEPFALSNFRDMAKVGSSEEVNIIVQFDRIGTYASTTPNWTQTLRFKVLKGMEPLPVNAVQDIGEANMGDGRVLGDFVQWTMAKYPAKKYMLVMWDHGQGYRVVLPFLSESFASNEGFASLLHLDSLSSSRSNMSGRLSGKRMKLVVGEPFRSTDAASYRSCSNDETNKDELYNSEMQDGLRVTLNDRKLDVIGFDCCLMSMIETAYGLRNLAKVFVGSEELEPGPGWKYDDWLANLRLNFAINEVDAGKLLVTSYQKAYAPGAMDDPSTTMAAINLRKIDSLAMIISSLANALTQNLATQLPILQSCRADCFNYAPSYSTICPFYHIDLSRFCNLVASRASDASIQAIAKQAEKYLVGSVIQNYAGASRLGNYGSNGLAIYFPPSESAYTSDVFAQNGYEKNNTFYPVQFVRDHTWADFLHEYFKLVK